MCKRRYWKMTPTLCGFVSKRWNFLTTATKRNPQISLLLYSASSGRKRNHARSVVVSRRVLRRQSCAAVTNIAPMSWSCGVRRGNVVRCGRVAAVAAGTWDHTHVADDCSLSVGLSPPRTHLQLTDWLMDRRSTYRFVHALAYFPVYSVTSSIRPSTCVQWCF